MSRRDWLKLGGAGVAGLSGASILALARRGGAAAALESAGVQDAVHSPQELAQLRMGVFGDHPPGDGFDPVAFLTDFDYGKVSRDSTGRTVREYEMVSVDREIEVAPGVWFPAWTYNGRVPGPTLRCTEGDLLRVDFSNAGSHPHTVHFHGTHPPRMDGVFPIVDPGERFTYEFEAKPFGLHPYHCHAIPLKRHIHKGLYGALIVDPPGGRSPAREMIMVMNGFDTNFDGENEIYAVNTAAFYYQTHPIRVGVGQPVRIYLVNMTEFDPINSLHLHAGMFRYYRTGTRLDQFDLTDTIMLCQGERGIIELELENPGLHMVHAHQSEFAELGWMSFLDAVPQLAADDGVPVHRYG
jgi:FtsP/CotA-like multicopper oxidase with cupredoxin domain